MEKPTPALTQAIFELFDEKSQALMDTVALSKKLKKHLNQEERRKLASVNRRYDNFERERDKIRIALIQEKGNASTPEQEAQYLIHCLAVRERQSEMITKLISAYSEIGRDYLARTGKRI
jgi:hypothetical protein